MSSVVTSGPRVALAHDYLTQRGGGERVALSLLRAFPGATIYTTLYDPEGTYPEFRDADVVVSPLNDIGFFRRHHRFTFPVLPLAARSLRIDADVVVASSSGWAHGFAYAPSTALLVYCHNPARWLYQTHDYLGHHPTRSVQGLALLALRPYLTHWDRRAAGRADAYLANSRVVQDRIRRSYGIEADVVAPPHGMDPSAPGVPIEAVADWADGYYLIVSRLMPYKNVHHAVDAFRGLPERLVVIGSGPMAEELARSLPGNVRMLSGLADAEMRWAYAHAQALVAPSYEDFGLTPLEAGAYGKPTLALRAGGYLDTVEQGVNGTFFEQATPSAIAAAVRDNRDAPWDSDRIRAHVEKFSETRFHDEVRRRVAELAAVGRRAVRNRGPA